tara:strand:+ start:203 stop:688 length:486 start_codon:yes stop_codon:yes gene_type:complete
MPKAFKSTFSFKKLANKLDKIIVDDLNIVGNHINKAIQDGIDKGKDINDRTFAPLEEITKDLGGRKPLNRTGNMRKTKKTPASSANKKFIIEMAGKSKKGRYYGAYHNTGFTQTNPKQWFYGSTVPQREWFGIPKSMFPGQSAYEKAIASRSLKIRSAWKK